MNNIDYPLKTCHNQNEHYEEHNRTLIEALEGGEKALWNESEDNFKQHVHVDDERRILTDNLMSLFERQLRC